MSDRFVELQPGDIITIDGVFRDGAMNEQRQGETANIQSWRVDRAGGTSLSPVLPNGETDWESFWYGRATGIAVEHGRIGVVSTPSTETA